MEKSARRSVDAPSALLGTGSGRRVRPAPVAGRNDGRGRGPGARRRPPPGWNRGAAGAILGRFPEYRPPRRLRCARARSSAPACSRLLPALLAAGLAASLAPSPAFANSYERGDYSCDDFQKSEKDYRSKPTGGYAVAYTLCLIARNQGDDVKALTILDSEIAKGHVSAARDKAVYVTTGGTMEQNNLDDRYYNEALQAYAKVLLLINLKPDYPEGFLFTELKEQHELEAYFFMVRISYFKFLAGLNGTHNAYLLQSASYKGDRNLKLHPKHQPYTIDSLEKTIEHAGRCANLPRKSHFKHLLYKKTIFYCRVMEEYARELLPLERERLTILNNQSCARDIEQCTKYREVLYKTIVPLVEKKEKEAKSAWKITN